MNKIKYSFIVQIEKIFSRKWEHSFKILYLSFIISFSLVAYRNLDIGFIMSPDSFAYSRWADYLIDLDFNLLKFYDQNTYVRPNYIYTVPVFLIALSKTIFGTEWQYAFMVLDLVLIFCSLIIFYKILILLNVRVLVISLSMLLFPMSVDLLTWPRYILSDTIFSFIVFFFYLFNHQNSCYPKVQLLSHNNIIYNVSNKANIPSLYFINCLFYDNLKIKNKL